MLAPGSGVISARSRNGAHILALDDLDGAARWPAEVAQVARQCRSRGSRRGILGHAPGREGVARMR